MWGVVVAGDSCKEEKEKVRGVTTVFFHSNRREGKERGREGITRERRRGETSEMAAGDAAGGSSSPEKQKKKETKREKRRRKRRRRR